MTIHKKIGRWFDVHEDELALFMWTMALLFLVRSSGILLNNYAETTFLKRFGVEYLPIVNMINAVLTLFIVGLMTGFMTRLPGARLLARLFVFCGLSVTVIRVIIPFGVDLVYPILFMLKSQFEVLLALLFWNLANDLFNTRQSKRLFPLITAGGVIGQILGSFATPFVARWLHLDNLLLVYLVTAMAGAWTMQAMGRRYPTLLFQQTAGPAKKKRSNMIEEIKAVLPLIKSSVLVKILVVLTFMPNVVIPIMNYQFNYAVSDQFATESGLIQFFGFYRGVLNTVSLIILLFVGKFYARFGLPVALMFHPFNYLLVFITFLLRFDLVAAVYARMSSNIIRTTLNIPAIAVVTGLFPESHRAMIRPFLRGSVVRIALFVGSGLILLSVPLFHPRYLSLVAMPFVLAWTIAPFVLKRRYADILLDLVTDDRIDLRTLDADQLSQMFRDKRSQAGLFRRFDCASGEARLWYGRLLRSIGAPDLDTHLLTALGQEKDLPTRIGLINLLSNWAGPAAMTAFEQLIPTSPPELAAAMVDVAHCLSPQTFAPFNRRIYESSQPMAVKARAVGSLHCVEPEAFGPVIEAWLSAEDTDHLCAGIVAAGVCRDIRFAGPLKRLLSGFDDDAVVLLVLKSLRGIQAKDINPLVAPWLSDPDPQMRHAALDLYQIEDEATLKKAIALLGDDSSAVAQLARRKIRNAAYQDSMRLVKSLSHPQKSVRDALFDLLADMAIKDLDVFRFVQGQARTCFQLMIQAQGVRQLSGKALQPLLALHLDERVWFTQQTMLRVLAAQDRSGRMHKIARGIFASDDRQRANSLEAMDDILDRNLVRLLAPLFDDSDIASCIAAGKRLFPGQLREPTQGGLWDGLLISPNWVTLVLTLGVMEEMAMVPKDFNPIEKLANHPNRHVSRGAKKLLSQDGSSSSVQEAAMETVASIPLTEKILHLKQIEIFSDLSVNELAAVAAVTEEASFAEGDRVFEEGERGDTLYLVIEGEVSVIKDDQSDNAIELDSIGPGDYFGEMALFGNDRRSATIRVKQAARFLTLNKVELEEIVREYPQIALHVCRVLSDRIRHLHGKVSSRSC